jgi:hypothetical protein
MIRAHPFVVVAAVLFMGVSAFGARLVAERRARRAAPPPRSPENVDAPAPPPRRQEPTPPRVWRAPPAPPPETTLAALHVRVTGPHGVLVRGAEVWATLRGDPDDEGTLLDENESGDGTFSATELAPGRYDVRVEAPGLREVRLADLPTGPKLIDVFLPRAAVLLGAVGDPHGEGTCDGVTVSATAPAADDQDGEPEELATNVDPDSCQFELEGLPVAGPLTVIAKGRGWTERALVTLPVEGDPAAVCFHGPCAARPASLAIYVVDAAGRLVPEVSLDWSRETETEGELGSTTIEGFGLLHGPRAGQPLHLHAAAGDRAVETTVFVAAGVSEVVLTLPVADEQPEVSPRGGDHEVVFLMR